MSATNPNPKKFMVTWNGDDSPVLGYFAEYADAANFAAETSEGDWMGTRMFGPSGKVATYKNGECSGYLDGTTRRWVTR